MLKFLVPVDGSETSLRAIDKLVKKLDWYRETVEIHLLNVQHPLPKDIAEFIAQEQIKSFHHDEGIKVLAGARAKLDAAGVGYKFHISVGDAGHVIAHFANDLRCDQIVMGTRGHGVLGVAIGSVATRVIHLTDVPVLLVK